MMYDVAQTLPRIAGSRLTRRSVQNWSRRLTYIYSTASDCANANANAKASANARMWRDSN